MNVKVLCMPTADSIGAHWLPMVVVIVTVVTQQLVTDSSHVYIIIILSL